MPRFISSFLTLIAISSLASAANPPTDAPTVPQVRAAIEKSLPFLEKKGVSWLDNAKCIACHHGAWMVWSMNEAKHVGVAVDPKTLDALSARVAAMYMKDVPNYLKKKTGWVESTYMFMSQEYTSVGETESAEWRKSAHEVLLARQRTDGSWKYAGQDLDRPVQENDEATTLLALLALPGASKGENADTAARDKALAWIKTIKQGPGLDSLALRLAVESRFGDAGGAVAMKNELISRQHPDGGWSWSEKRPSDAFATGEALYVLSLAGEKGDTPAIAKAWKFLIDTQQPDGSWLCTTRKPKGENKISTYWGTAWAVIGLARSLPAAGDSEARAHGQ